MVKNLVIPPSASASYTISAFDKPDCGLASVLFSIMIPKGACCFHHASCWVEYKTPLRGHGCVLGSVGSNCNAPLANFCGGVITIAFLGNRLEKIKYETPRDTTKRITRRNTNFDLFINITLLQMLGVLSLFLQQTDCVLLPRLF